jgi:hypothetical protein
MRGLGQSVVYISLVGLVAGTIWLFWGKAIVKEYDQFKAKKPAVAKAEKRVAETKEDLGRRVKPVNAAAEWQKARSGLDGLVALQVDETRRDLESLSSQYDARLVYLLRQVKLYKEPAAVTPAVPQPLKRRAKS